MHLLLRYQQWALHPLYESYYVSGLGFCKSQIIDLAFKRRAARAGCEGTRLALAVLAPRSCFESRWSAGLPVSSSSPGECVALFGRRGPLLGSSLAVRTVRSPSVLNARRKAVRFCCNASELTYGERPVVADELAHCARHRPDGSRPRMGQATFVTRPRGDQTQRLQELEPLDDASPLYTMDNVIITPHMGWRGLETRQRLVSMIGDNIRAFASGRPINRVDEVRA